MCVCRILYLTASVLLLEKKKHNSRQYRQQCVPHVASHLFQINMAPGGPDTRHPVNFVVEQIPRTRVLKKASQAPNSFSSKQNSSTELEKEFTVHYFSLCAIQGIERVTQRSVTLFYETLRIISYHYYVSFAQGT